MDPIPRFTGGGKLYLALLSTLSDYSLQFSESLPGHTRPRTRPQPTTAHSSPMRKVTVITASWRHLGGTTIQVPAHYNTSTCRSRTTQAPSSYYSPRYYSPLQHLQTRPLKCLTKLSLVLAFSAWSMYRLVKL